MLHILQSYSCGARATAMAGYAGLQIGVLKNCENEGAAILYRVHNFIRCSYSS